MSLYKRGRKWWYRFCWEGKQYRGPCKTSKKSEAKNLESRERERVVDGKSVPGSKKTMTLNEFAIRFFAWLESLPSDRPPKEGTKRYYRQGWNLLKSTRLAGMRIDRIRADDVRATAVGSSPANTNNALRTLRHMLRKAREWELLDSTPTIRMVEEAGREQLIEPWMEQKLLAVTEIKRTPDSKHAPKFINYGWEPFRSVLLIMLDSGLRPGEVYRMRWEHIYWNRDAIFVPRGKSRKSRRLVPLSERVRTTLMRRSQNEGWVFPSSRARSGHIETLQKQWTMAKKLAGLPDGIVLYCARHRFGSDAMEGTGNVYAVMDVMGHSRMDVARIYQHPGVRQVGVAINKRNETVQ
jgi:integrase